MADVFYIKQGNQRPYLKATLERLDDEGNVEGPADLTDADIITFTMKNSETGQIIVDEGDSVVILGDPIEGNVQYEWQIGDTDVSGEEMLGEFDVTYTNGETETFPNSKEGFKIKITPQLGL